MEKALVVLKSPIVEIGSDSDFNLQSKAVVLFATREQIQEAIAELQEAMKPKTCNTCKYSFYWECADVLECTKLDKQHCCNCEEDLNMTEVVGDFYCNRYEPKDTQ